MKVSFIGCRYKRYSLSVWGKTWLDIYRASRGHLAGLAIPHIERPQLNCIVNVTREYHPAAVGRPIRLIVITWASSKLIGFWATQFLPPQRPGHRIHKTVGIGRPRLRARASGQLRQIHLAKIIGMRKVDLLENWFTLRQAAINSDE